MGEVVGEVELLKGEVGKLEKEEEVRSGLFRDFCMAASGLRYGFVHSCIA